MFEESSMHLDECFAKYRLVTLLPDYAYIKKVNVQNSNKQDVKLYTKQGFCYPLTSDEELLVKTQVNLPENLSAPLKVGQIVGNIKIYLDNRLLFCEKIYTMEDVKSNRISDILKDIIAKW